MNEIWSIRFGTVCFDQWKSSLVPWEIRKNVKEKWGSVVMAGLPCPLQWVILFYLAVSLPLLPSSTVQIRDVVSFTVEDVRPVVITIVKKLYFTLTESRSNVAPEKIPCHSFWALRLLSRIKRGCSSRQDSARLYSMDWQVNFPWLPVSGIDFQTNIHTQNRTFFFSHRCPSSFHHYCERIEFRHQTICIPSAVLQWKHETKVHLFCLISWLFGEENFAESWFGNC